MSIRRFAWLVSLFLVLACGPLWADELGKFEEDVARGKKTRPQETSRDRYYRERNEHLRWEHQWLDSIWSLAFQESEAGFDWNCFHWIGEGFSYSNQRMRRNPVPLRENGDPLVPLVRIDGAWQDVSDEIEARDWYGQLGYGAIGVDYRRTCFDQSHPQKTLRMEWGHILSRLSYGSQVEVDLGMGIYTLTGEEKTSGFSLTSAVLYYPSDHWGLEFRPTVAWINQDTTVNDFDLALHLRHEAVGLKFGYRWTKSTNVTLDGPYAGLVLRW